MKNSAVYEVPCSDYKYVCGPSDDWRDALEEAHFLIETMFEGCPVSCAMSELPEQDGVWAVVRECFDRWASVDCIDDVGAFIMGDIISKLGVNVRFAIGK